MHLREARRRIAIHLQGSEGAGKRLSVVCEERLVSLVANLGVGLITVSRGGRAQPYILFEKVDDDRALVEGPRRVIVIESERRHEAFGRQLQQLRWLLVRIDLVYASHVW